MIIFGISGQDGYYLSKKLDSLNFNIYGISRNAKKIKKIKKIKIILKILSFLVKIFVTIKVFTIPSLKLNQI